MVFMHNFIIVSLKRRYNRLFYVIIRLVNDMKEEKKAQIEELTEEIEKKKINFGRLFLCTLFVLFSLIAVFFLATFVRWKAEINNKYPILYRGQEEIKVDKLIDFYGIELSPELKTDEAIYMYCSSEYGKNCIMPNYSNFLENNFREPLLVISIICFIDLVLVYILLKEYLNGKKRTYIYGAIIVLWGLFLVGKAVYKVADYYKEIKFDKTTEGEVVNYLRSDYKNEYIPVYRYVIEKPQMKMEEQEDGGEEKEPDYTYDFPKSYTIKGEFKKEKIKLYYEGNYELITPRRDMKRYIIPATFGLLTVIIGFIYLNINRHFKRLEEKEKKKQEAEKK